MCTAFCLFSATGFSMEQSEMSSKAKKTTNESKIFIIITQASQPPIESHNLHIKVKQNIRKVTLTGDERYASRISG